MKKSGTAAIAAAGVVLLGGGGYALGAMNDPEPTPTPTQAPVAAPEPVTTPTPEPQYVGSEADYLEQADSDLRAWGVSMPAEDIIAVGYEACEMIAAGAERFAVTPIEGGSKAANDVVRQAAADHLCN